MLVGGGEVVGRVLSMGTHRVDVAILKRGKGHNISHIMKISDNLGKTFDMMRYEHLTFAHLHKGMVEPLPTHRTK